MANGELIAPKAESTPLSYSSSHKKKREIPDDLLREASNRLAVMSLGDPRGDEHGEQHVETAIGILRSRKQSFDRERFSDVGGDNERRPVRAIRRRLLQFCFTPP